MSDRVTVKFQMSNGKSESEVGQWCFSCKFVISWDLVNDCSRCSPNTSSRLDEKFVKKNGTRKAFFKGGNSSCRQHIRQHYNIYKKRCEEAKISLNHWAIPRDIWAVMEEEKEPKTRDQRAKSGQQQLDFQVVSGPREFTRSSTLQAVTMLIASNNQVSFDTSYQYHKTTHLWL